MSSAWYSSLSYAFKLILKKDSFTILFSAHWEFNRSVVIQSQLTLYNITNASEKKPVDPVKPVEPKLVDPVKPVEPKLVNSVKSVEPKLVKSVNSVDPKPVEPVDKAMHVDTISLTISLK